MSASATFLSILRGGDGRRLAVVVALCLAFAGFLGAANSALAAAGQPVLCKVDGDGGSKAPPAAPAGHGHVDCCLAGHSPVAGPVPQGVALPSDYAPGPAATRPPAYVSPVAVKTLASEGPRGPPLSA